MVLLGRFHAPFFLVLFLFLGGIDHCFGFYLPPTSKYHFSLHQLAHNFKTHAADKAARQVLLGLNQQKNADLIISESRRTIFKAMLAAVPFFAFCQLESAWALSIDEAREIGEKKFLEIEKAKGEKKTTATGIKFRESKVGNGVEVKERDVCYISYQATRINGDYMFSLGRNKELKRDEGEQYRLVLGKHQVPIAVEMGMEGMKEGGIRNILVPPNLGWSTSKGLPQPDTYSGKRKLELNIDNPILFEVQLIRVRRPQ